MAMYSKGKSPFYPGQPVPVELFTGRQEQIDRIERAIHQVSLGKPQFMFLTGEYGIGKSSLAGYMKRLAERKYNLFGIHVLLGSAESEDELAELTVKSVLETEAYHPSNTEKVRNFLANYIGNQQLFGLSLNLEKLKSDAPSISNGFLPFLKTLYERLKGNQATGLFLILDELNGITKNPKFSYFIKNLVDQNALSAHPLPIMMMLVGVEERRRDMIKHHQPIDRIFEIVRVAPLEEPEMREFFDRSFKSVGCQIDKEAMDILSHYSAGFPKAMHIIANNAFWIDNDNLIDKNDANRAIELSAREIGEQFVDEQVFKALRSGDYQNILKKLAMDNFDLAFFKNQVEQGLSEAEKKKFDNFLQKMKKLNVIKSGDERGEYIFLSRLIRLYIKMRSLENSI